MLVLTGATTGVTTAKETEDSGETVCNLRRMEALPPHNLLLEGLAHYALTSCVSVVIAQGIMRTIVQNGNGTSGNNITLSQFGFVFVQSQPRLPSTLIIVDTGSTFSSFFNRGLMDGVGVCLPIRGHTNGGFLDYNKGRGP